MTGCRFRGKGLLLGRAGEGIMGFFFGRVPFGSTVGIFYITMSFPTEREIYCSQERQGLSIERLRYHTVPRYLFESGLV